MQQPPAPPPVRSSRQGVLLAWLVGGGFVLAVLLTVAFSGLLGGVRDRIADDVPSAAPSMPSEDAGRYGGSGAVALAWVQALADGDAQRAYDLTCPPVQASSAAADPDDPARGLARYVRSQLLGGEGFTVGAVESVEHHADSGTDRVTITVRTDSGRSLALAVSVTADLRVCDFR